MRLDLYQNETTRIAAEQSALVGLANNAIIAADDLPAWNAIIGLRNRLVHDYMNIDMEQIIALLVANKEQFAVDCLRKEVV